MHMPSLKDIITQAPLGITKGALLISETVQLPYTLIKHAHDAPIVTITAGVHGCEYVGIKVSNMVVPVLATSEFNPYSFLILHVVNPTGFQKRITSVVPEDAINLNRIFQTTPYQHSLAFNIQQTILSEVLPITSVLFDLHGGNNQEWLTPHVYYSTLSKKEIVACSKQLAHASGLPILYASTATGGLYQAASIDYDVPSILIEQGENGTCTVYDTKAMQNTLLRCIRFLCTGGYEETEQEIYTSGEMLHAQFEGLWTSECTTGMYVHAHQAIGTICSIYGDHLETLYAPQSGKLLYQKASLPVIAGEEVAFIASTHSSHKEKL